MAELKDTYVRFETAGGFMSERIDSPVTSTDLTELERPDGAISAQFFKVSAEEPNIYANNYDHDYEAELIAISPVIYLGGNVIHKDDADKEHPEENGYGTKLSDHMTKAGTNYVVEVNSPHKNFEILDENTTVVDVDDNMKQIWPVISEGSYSLI